MLMLKAENLKDGMKHADKKDLQH
jgi:hypothetical protein